MKHAFLILLLAFSAMAQPASPAADLKPDKIFDEVADSALTAMKRNGERRAVSVADKNLLFALPPVSSRRTIEP
jgi:hypothetical protein